MARTPFLPQYRGYSWGLSTQIIPDDIKALIAKPILEWPYVEQNLALILGFLLNANIPAVAALFSTIRQGRNQREAIRVAAEAVISDEKDKRLFSAVLALLKSAEMARNDMAHGCWGELRTSPNAGNELQLDAAVWIEAKHNAPVATAAAMSDLAGGEFQPPHRTLERFMFVYRRQDLTDVSNLVELAFMATHHLLNMLSHDARNLPAQTSPSRGWLCNQPQIQKFLDRLDGDQSS